MPEASSSLPQEAADLEEPGVEVRIGVARLVVGEGDHVVPVISDIPRGRDVAIREGASGERLTVRVRGRASIGVRAAGVVTRAPSVCQLVESVTAHAAEPR